MVVPSQKVGERIVSGDDVVVHVLETRGQRVRLGVQAPHDIGVWGEEMSESRQPVAVERVPKEKPR
jgi:carbon storage regulator